MINTGDFWWVVALSVACLGVWAIFMVFIPSCLCSLFRYRLWRLRDTVKDEILQAQLPDQEVVHEFLSVIESAILLAEKITLIQVLFLPVNERALHQQRRDSNRLIQQLDEGSRSRFLAHRKEFMGILILRLFIGSVGGWVFLVGLLPAIPIMLICRVVQRASVSITDVLISAIRFIERVWARALRKDPDLDWQSVAGRIVTMRRMSDPPKTLSECAA